MQVRKVAPGVLARPRERRSSFVLWGTLMDVHQPPLKLVPDRRQIPVERRRSTRAECQVPVVVKWMAPDGTEKEEATETKVINAHGCLLLLKAPLPERTRVELVNHDTKEVRRGRIAWSGGVGADRRNRVAIELEDPDPKFWGPRYIDFLLWVALQTGRLAG